MPALVKPRQRSASPVGKGDTVMLEPVNRQLPYANPVLLENTVIPVSARHHRLCANHAQKADTAMSVRQYAMHATTVIVIVIASAWDAAVRARLGLRQIAGRVLQVISVLTGTRKRNVQSESTAT